MGTAGISSPSGLAAGKIRAQLYNTPASTHIPTRFYENPGVIRRRGVSRSRYRSVNPCRRRRRIPLLSRSAPLSPSITISAMQPAGDKETVQENLSPRITVKNGIGFNQLLIDATFKRLKVSKRNLNSLKKKVSGLIERILRIRE